MGLRGLRSLVALVVASAATAVIAALAQPGASIEARPIIEPSPEIVAPPAISEGVFGPPVNLASDEPSATPPAAAALAAAKRSLLEANPTVTITASLPVLQLPSLVTLEPTVTEALSDAGVATGSVLAKPAQGRYTSRFGTRFHPILHVWKLHSGLDIAASCGTPVGAAAAGVVTRVGYAGGNGLQVRVDHGQLAGRNVVTTYNHLSTTAVRVGQSVRVHQGLGRIGNTGYSTGCHLHFEVIVDGRFVDPEPWLSGGSAQVIYAADLPTGPIPGPSSTPSSTPTPSDSGSPSLSASPSPSASSTKPGPSGSPSVTHTPSSSPSPSATPTSSTKPTKSADPPSNSPSASGSPSGSPSTSPSASASPSPSPSSSPSASPDPESPSAPSESGTPTSEPTQTSQAPTGGTPSESVPEPTGG